MKCWRSPTSRVSLGTAVVLSSITAAIASWRHFGDPSALSLIASLLATSVVADIRGTCQAQNPAEIAAIKGTNFFMKHYLLASATAVLLITLPLLVPILLQSHGIIPESVTICFALAQLAIGCAAGLISGTLLVPQARDISGQFSAVLLCLVLLLLPTYTPGLRSLSLTWSSCTTLMFAIICLSTAQLIEYKRNPYAWRHHA